MKNYYKILGIDQTASMQEIKQAHKALQAEYSAKDAHERGYTAERYIDISIAFDTLIHPEKRTEYDRILNSALITTQDIPAKTQKKAPEADSVEERTFIPPAKRWKANYGLIYICLLLLVLSAVTFIQIRSTWETEPITEHAKISRGILQLTAQATKDRQSRSLTKKQADSAVAATFPPAQPEAAATIPKEETKVARTANTGVKDQIAVHKKDPVSVPTPVPASRIAEVKPEPRPLAKAADNPVIGTSKKEVLRTLGTPSTIVRYDNDNEIWRYANRNIHFSSNKIISDNRISDNSYE